MAPKVQESQAQQTSSDLSLAEKYFQEKKKYEEVTYEKTLELIEKHCDRTKEPDTDELMPLEDVTCYIKQPKDGTYGYFELKYKVPSSDWNFLGRAYCDHKSALLKKSDQALDFRYARNVIDYSGLSFLIDEFNERNDDVPKLFTLVAKPHELTDKLNERGLRIYERICPQVPGLQNETEVADAFFDEVRILLSQLFL